MVSGSLELMNLEQVIIENNGKELKLQSDMVCMYMSVIPDPQEAEAGELQIKGQPGQFNKTLSK